MNFNYGYLLLNWGLISFLAQDNLTKIFTIMSKEKDGGYSRRRFLGTTAAATAGFTIVPSTVISGMGHIAPSDKLNIAAVGVGGMGASNLRGITEQNIVALCDVDHKYAAGTFKKYPDAK